jgi:hypothetical protein
MSEDTTVTALLGLSVPLALTIVKNGDGQGKVTSDPARIDCGSSCSATFGATTLVTLTPIAEPGSVFTGWSSPECSGVGTCTFRIVSETTVTATFSKATPFLDVSVSTLDFGTVMVGTVAREVTSLRNLGDGPLTIAGITVAVGSITEFSASQACVGTLAAGASCDLEVSFAPTEAGFAMATLAIASDSGGSATTHHVVLAGTGISA